MPERVVCLMGHGDCPETCPAHYANENLTREMKIRHEIDLTQFSPKLLKIFINMFPSARTVEMLTEKCQKEKGRADQAEATD